MKKNILIPINYTETVTYLDESGNEVTEEVTKVRMEESYVDLSAEEEQEILAQQNSPQAKLERIEQLKAELAKLDYIGTKIATGRATREEYADEIALMNQYADEINQLESEVGE